MSRVGFMSADYVRNDYRPTPQLGRFDAIYTPHLGTIDIKVRMNLDFRSSGVNSGTPIPAWTVQEQLEWVQNAKKRINEYWNNRFIITCRKQGFTDLAVRPIFHLDSVAPTGSPHYTIISHKHVNMAFKANVDTAGTGKLSYKAADEVGDAATQIRNIKTALKGPLTLPVNNSPGGQFTFTVMAYLESFANSAVEAFGSNRPKLKIKAMGTKKNAFAERVKMILYNFGMQGWPVKISSENTFQSGTCTGVTLSWDDAQFEANFPADASVKPLFSQSIVPHEYGHMLGLPDEYNVLCSHSTNHLRTIGMIPNDGHSQALLTAGKVRATDAESQNIGENQKLFHQTCLEAGIVPPSFGRPNENIMSAGRAFKPYHAIYVWKVLSEMTSTSMAKSDWRIEMA